MNDCKCSSATLHGSQNRNLPLHASTVLSTAMFFRPVACTQALVLTSLAT